MSFNLKVKDEFLNLYSFPAQKGDKPPETSIYKMTPMAQRSEAKVA